MELHIKSPGSTPGVYPLVTRGKELKYLSFTIVELGDGLAEHSFESGEEELSLDSYTGAIEVEAVGYFGKWSAEIGTRPTMGKPHPMIYLPAGCRVRVKALDGTARITLGGAIGRPGIEPVMVGGSQIVERVVGRDNWVRTVYTHIADNVPAAHLICGETVNQPGGWSSCPPHKHDRFSPPSEVPMEEVYYFQLEPHQGFGFMRVYSDPADDEKFDHAYAVEHGDTVLIPRGYHPVAACPGYTLNYTWILAGEGRQYGAWTDDPKHAWVKG